MAEQLSVREILVKARELISDPARWTQRQYARNASGEGVLWDNRDATCWCTDGALMKSCGTYHTNCVDAFSGLLRAVGMNPITFNDSHTHAEVLAMFDKAIEASK